MTNSKYLYDQAHVRVVSFRAAVSSQLREKGDKCIDEGQANDPELHIMPYLVEEVTKLWNWFAKLQKTVPEGEPSVAVMTGFWKEVSAIWEAVSELLPAVERMRDQWVDDGKKVRMAKVGLLSVKHRKSCFDETT